MASQILEDRAEADGRRAIREQHTDNLGLLYDVLYLAEAATDAAAMLTTHATNLAAQLQTNEITANVQRALLQQTWTTNYSTLTQFRAALRAFYQTCSSWDATRIGNFINSLNLTDAQLASIFGFANPSTQLTNLKNLLAAQASRYAAVAADAGV